MKLMLKKMWRARNEMDNQELRATQIAYVQEINNGNYEKALELNSQLHKEYSEKFPGANQLKKEYYKLRIMTLEESAIALKRELSGENPPKDTTRFERKVRELGEICRNLKIEMIRRN